MRIGFLGKGGSGKTTITAGFARWLETVNERVIAFDGDVNSHLQHALGLEASPPHLGAHYDEIAAYVRGDRTDLGDRPLLSTTPPSPRSRFISTSDTDPLLARFGIHRGTLTFLSVGSFEKGDVGANCYHTKLHALCVLLNHLKDSHKDYIVIDATAGIDTLSTSLVTAYDLNVFVVEPTLKSIQVCLDYLSTDPESGARTVVLANKIMPESDDLDFIARHIPTIPLIGSLSHSAHLRSFEQGDNDAFNRFLAELESVWKNIKNRCDSTGHSWGGFQHRLHKIHEKNCEWWYNAYYGTELHTGLDPHA